jgi:hypothetical protein
MGHRVRDNINRQWISDIFTESVEKVDVVAFPLPPISIIGVEATEHH